VVDQLKEPHESEYYKELTLPLLREAQAFLQAYQFPDECDNNNTSYIIYKYRETGLGSELALLSGSFALGLGLNRIVVPDGVPWFARNNFQCNGTGGNGAWLCYFTNAISGCSPSSNQMPADCDKVDQCALTGRSIHHHIKDNLMSIHTKLKRNSHGIPAIFDALISKFYKTWEEKMHWWRAVVITWLTHPNHRFQTHINETIDKIFPSGVPDLIFLHIRGSDKWGEMKLLQPASYFTNATELIQKHDNLRHLRDFYINTEDSTVADQLRRELREGRICYENSTLSSEEKVVCMKNLSGLCDSFFGVCLDWSYYRIHMLEDSSRIVSGASYNVNSGRGSSYEIMLNSMTSLQLSYRFSKIQVITTKSNWSAIIDWHRRARPHKKIYSIDLSPGIPIWGGDSI